MVAEATMAANHLAPGRFRARLMVRGVPTASRFDYEVGFAASPEAALDTALSHLDSLWQGPPETPRYAEVFRYSAYGELESAASFLAYVR